MAIVPSPPRHLLATAVGINQIRDAPDWTRTSMPIKAQALNLPCIPNSTTGADESPNYTHQEIRLSSEISVFEPSLGKHDNLRYRGAHVQS